MKIENYIKGKKGEDIAADYLSKHGFQIVEKNFATKWGEIDLIATKEKTLHFVEMKLKVGDRFGTPEEMISKRKIIQVMKTAESYLLKNKKVGDLYSQIQVDAICIVLSSSEGVERIDFYDNLSAEL